MVVTLSKSGSSWATSNVREYDVLVSVQTGAQTGGSARRYCVSLGHVQHESELVYMRARYYEPSSGRFVSEQPACDKLNWLVYAYSCPTMNSNPDGLLVNPAIGMVEGMEVKVAEAQAAMASSNGAIYHLLNAVARHTLNQVSALAAAGVAAGQQFVTRVGQITCNYVVGRGTGMGAFANKTSITGGAGDRVLLEIFSGNNTGIYNLLIRFIEMEHWLAALNGRI